MPDNSYKIRLDEITIMRAILALLIVFMHSFTCYNGGWAEPKGFIQIPLYKWLSRFSFAFTLQGFVFISGYLFAFQRITLNREEKFKKLIYNKFKRLIIPSIIFSVVYFVVFYEYKGVLRAVYEIINGCGHMWYLPMLFWCFIGAWFLLQLNIADRWKLLFLMLINLIAIYPLPFQLSRTANFLVYFYGGYLTYKHRHLLLRRLNLNNLLVFWIIFLVTFIVLRQFRDVLEVASSVSTLKSLLNKIISRFFGFIYSWTGLLAFYATAILYIKKHQLSKLIQCVATCSFGIYLFQQFILQFLYYKTDFSSLVGPYWLPWCGFVFTMVLSFLLSFLLLKTKVGRFLIG